MQPCVLVALALIVLVHAQTNCIADPEDSSCADFTMPASLVQQGIDMNCNRMGWMLVQTICQKEDAARDSMYCMPFGVLKTLCLDMAMGGCANYSLMCAPDTAVEECNMTVLPLGKTSAMQSLITGICSQMPGMTGCSDCSNGKKCDVLTTYSTLCLEMPDMDQCSLWNNMCKYIPEWSICGGGGNAPPQMRMYFHSSIRDYILFKFAVPESKGLYALAILLVIAAAVGYELLKWLHIRLDKHWKDVKRAGYAAVSNPNASPDDFYFSVDVPRAALRALQFAFSYLLMLIAMTFNVGLFLALVAGIFLGHLIVGRFLAASNADCCG